jgi:hypothetical protein
VVRRPLRPTSGSGGGGSSGARGNGSTAVRVNSERLHISAFYKRVGLLYSFLVQPVMTVFMHEDMPQLDGSLLSSLLTAMLGLTVARTVEKYHGTARK